MLRNYFETSMKVYIPVFMLLYVATWYLSTLYIADAAWIANVFNESSENLKITNTLFFAYGGLKKLISWLIKTILIAFSCYVILRIPFGKILRIGLLSMIAYVFANLAGFIYKLFFFLIPSKSSVPILLLFGVQG